MKNKIIIPFLFATIVTVFTSCNSTPTADQYLQDDHQRKGIVLSMTHHQPYMAEMMHEMMNNDTCKKMMMDNMMNDPSMMKMHMEKMMSMCKNDSTMCKMMMDKTMEMCEADTSKCNMMKGAMQSHSTVMKGMCDMENMK
jgi:hypothetical protein